MKTKSQPVAVTFGAISRQIPVAYCGGYVLDCGALDALSLQLGCTIEDAARYCLTDSMALEVCRVPVASMKVTETVAYRDGKPVVVDHITFEG